VNWADEYIKALRRGETVQFRPCGRSMEGKIADGQLVIVEPLRGRIPKVGDVVLCSVQGAQYLHLVKAVKRGLYQIGNNKGRLNGWCSLEHIYGLYLDDGKGADG